MDAKELTQEELRSLLEGEVRTVTGMSLDEFTAALEQGRLDPETPRIAGLAILVGARTG